jgi:hypothetical protein
MSTPLESIAEPWTGWPCGLNKYTSLTFVCNMEKRGCEEFKCRKPATRVAYPVDDCVKLKEPVYVCDPHAHSFDAAIALGTNRFWKPTEALKPPSAAATQTSPTLSQ